MAKGEVNQGDKSVFGMPVGLPALRRILQEQPVQNQWLFDHQTERSHLNGVEQSLPSDAPIL